MPIYSLLESPDSTTAYTCHETQEEHDTSERKEKVASLAKTERKLRIRTEVRMAQAESLFPVKGVGWDYGVHHKLSWNYHSSTS